jgi:NADP-dependent 3-hydroxy acid dehydrogenase YdfG
MIKTALVTGATSGMVAAQILAQNNYKIILCGRREPLKILQRTFALQKFTLTFDVRDKSGFRKY